MVQKLNAVIAVTAASTSRYEEGTLGLEGLTTIGKEDRDPETINELSLIYDLRIGLGGQYGQQA